MTDAQRAQLEALLATGGPWAPKEIRRIAELTEAVHGDDRARSWWVQAAAAGDPDAEDYLMVLILENEVFETDS